MTLSSLAPSLSPDGSAEDVRTTLVDEVERSGRPRAIEARPKDRCWLTLLTGPCPGQIFKLQGEEMIIGRGGDAHAYLVHPALSRAHARVFRREDGIHIEDLGSANGTFVHGLRVREPTRLRDGDRIELGRSIILKFAEQDALEEQTAIKLYDSSVRDALTKTYNRQYFDDRFASELAFAQRHGSTLSVLMIDVDHFKRFNDTYGHAAGDAVLRVVGAALSRMVRREDIVARYGGEEFIIAARSLAHDNAVILGERIRKVLEGLRMPWESEALHVTASIGVATLGDGRRYQSGADLIAAADSALYRAKETGRNRVVSA